MRGTTPSLRYSNNNCDTSNNDATFPPNPPMHNLPFNPSPTPTPPTSYPQATAQRRRRYFAPESASSIVYTWFSKLHLLFVAIVREGSTEERERRRRRVLVGALER
jgi:hypothetical protein